MARTVKSKSVIPYKRVKAEKSAISHFPLPQYIQNPSLSKMEERKLRSNHVKKQTNVVQKRGQLTKNYMNLPNKVASAAKRKPATKNVYNKFQIPNDIRKKINKMVK